MASRDLTQADPQLQKFFEAVKDTFAREFVDGGYTIRLTCVYRSPQEQNTIFKLAEGRTQIDGITKLGKHNVIPSQAIDFGVFDARGRYIDEIPAFNPVLRKALYAFVGHTAMLQGFRWGGDWNSNEVPVDVDPAEHLNDPYHIETRGTDA